MRAALNGQVIAESAEDRGGLRMSARRDPHRLVLPQPDRQL
jgi:hypothetical protein